MEKATRHKEEHPCRKASSPGLKQERKAQLSALPPCATRVQSHGNQTTLRSSALLQRMMPQRAGATSATQTRGATIAPHSKTGEITHPRRRAQRVPVAVALEALLRLNTAELRGAQLPLVQRRPGKHNVHETGAKSSTVHRRLQMVDGHGPEVPPPNTPGAAHGHAPVNEKKQQMLPQSVQ